MTQLLSREVDIVNVDVIDEKTLNFPLLHQPLLEEVSNDKVSITEWSAPSQRKDVEETCKQLGDLLPFYQHGNNNALRPPAHVPLADKTRIMSEIGVSTLPEVAAEISRRFKTTLPLVSPIVLVVVKGSEERTEVITPRITFIDLLHLLHQRGGGNSRYHAIGCTGDQMRFRQVD